MPIVIVIFIAYVVWRVWKSQRRTETERLRILEARVRLLEEQLDQGVNNVRWVPAHEPIKDGKQQGRNETYFGVVPR